MKKTNFWNLIKEKQISIPVNQREYAQGRRNSKSDEVRAKLVNDFYVALTESKNLSLDLIYGSLEEGKFIPYDGQQRLTSLFLLHWLIATRASKLNEIAVEREKITAADLLHRFRYDMREETQKFCDKLIDAARTGALLDDKAINLKTTIRDQPWYDAKWDRDPSISGMITMLGTLNDKFEGMDFTSAWNKLTNEDVANFQYEEIGTIGVGGEELYITMNSRGKELGKFEKFKPKFLELIAKQSPGKSSAFASKMDGKWLDFFWNNFGMKAGSAEKGERTDEAFYYFLWFIVDMFRFLPMEHEQPAEPAELEPVAALFCRAELALNPARENFWPGHSNLEFLEAALDILSDYKGPCEDLFNEYFHAAGDDGMPVAGKISWFDKSADLVAYICAKDRRAATHPRRHMLLGFLLWLVSSQSERERLRHLRNLAINSSNELGRTEDTGRQLLGMATLILNGLADSMKKEKLKEQYLQSRYNGNQLKEEIAKHVLIVSDPKAAEPLFWLEDHPFLRGNLSVASSSDTSGEPIFNLSALDKIRNLFALGLGSEKIDWSTWLRALLATSAFDWWREEGFFWWKPSLRLYDASTIARREIFIGQAPAERLPCSRKSIQAIADWGKNHHSRDELIQTMEDKCSRWLNRRESNGELDWSWYFVKYPSMLPNDTLGYYHWGRAPWSFLQRQLSKAYASSINWNPFLWAVWVAAGFEDLKDRPAGLKWIENPGAESDNYINFPCNLTLRAAEFGWLILTPAWRKPDSRAFHNLRKIHERLNENGYFYCPGVNMLDGEEKSRMPAEWTESLDGESDYNGANWRKFDNKDRVALGVELALKMIDL